MSAPFYWIGVRRGPQAVIPRPAIPFARNCSCCSSPTLFTVASMDDALAAPDRYGRRLTPICLQCACRIEQATATGDSR